MRSRLPEAFYADLFSSKPFFLSPLVTGSKVVRADKLGEEPDIGDPDIKERFASHGGADFQSPASESVNASMETLASRGEGESKESAKEASRKVKAQKRAKKADRKANDEAAKARQKAFGTHEALSSQYYEPGIIYTFDYFDSFFRPDSFTIDLAVKKLNVCPIIGDQPLIIDMAKVRKRDNHATHRTP